MEEHFDLAPHELARLHGPVGVFIGSKTPSEIAVSILAEVIATKNGVEVPHDMLVAPGKDRHELVAPQVACDASTASWPSRQPAM